MTSARHDRLRNREAHAARDSLPGSNGRATTVSTPGGTPRAIEHASPDDLETARRLRNVVAGSAHDMAGFLLAIDSNLDLLAAEWLSKDATGALRSLRTANSYLRDLAKELRMAAAESGVTGPTRQTSLAVWWPDMDALLRALHGDDIIVRAEIPPELPGVCIKSHHLTQVVLNLVGNSAHALAESSVGSKSHAESADSSGRAQIAISAQLARGGQAVRLDVADNGPGMSPEVLAHACEPSFTTRAGRGGTGLGLAMVHRLVGAAGGRVRLSSAVGAGTTVTLELPASPG